MLNSRPRSKNLLDSIRGEDRTNASYKANPYMTPSLAPRRWSAWMSNIFIALILVVAGIILLSISAELDESDSSEFYIGGWACMIVGGCFLLLGFCWYKNIQSHEDAEKLVDDLGDSDDRLQSPTSLNTSTTRLSEENETGSVIAGHTGKNASPPMSPPKIPPPMTSALRAAHPEVKRPTVGQVRFQQPPVYQYK